jgi:hypothetical protein
MKDVRTVPAAGPADADVGSCLAFHPLASVLVRGQENSTLKGACERCGLAYYWPQPAGDVERWYLVRDTLLESRAIYDGNAVSLILREDIFRRVQRLNLRDVRLREIPILDKPIDGLPADLPVYLTPERQRQLGDLLTRDSTEYDRRWAQRMRNASEVQYSPDSG